MENSAPQQPKVFRRGETIFKAGDPVTHVFLIQSGLAAVTVLRGGKVIEIAQVSGGQILGEEALWGTHKWTASAVANNDVRALPIEVPQSVAVLTSGAPMIKAFVRGLLEKQRSWWSSLIDIKTEVDPTPCPPERVTKLFAVIYQVASYTGTRKKNETTVVWPTFKKYCQRTFLESPVRLEQAVNILVKQGCARLEMIPCETDPEAPDELGFVHFSDLDRVKSFYEFYRALYFTPPKGDGLPQTDKANLAILREIDEWNKNGRVTLPPSQEKSA